MEKKNYIVAIDLGSSSVAVVVASKLPEGKIAIEGHAIREMQGVVRGEIKNIEQVAQSIKEAVEELEQNLGIKITEAYTGISGQHLRCVRHPYYVYVGGKDGEICDDDVRKLNDSMRNVQAPDGHKILQIIPQHYIVNGEEEVANPVGMFGKTLESTFNLIIGDSSIVARLGKALDRVDLQQKDMYINPLVSAEAVVLPDEKEMGVVVVDLGAGTTDICIYRDKIVRYVGVIPMGADTINKDIRAYGILERYVEDLKVKYGSAVAETADPDKVIKVPGRTPREPKSISFQNLASIIEARMKDIVEYVMQEVKEAGYEDKLSAGIVLTGGAAQLKDVDVLFRNMTGLDVRIASPDIHVSLESLETAANTRLATVIGIAVRAAETGEMSSFATIRTTATPAAPTIATPRTVQPAPAPSEPQQGETIGTPAVAEPIKKRKKKDKDNAAGGWSIKIKGLTDKITKIFDSEVIDDEF